MKFQFLFLALILSGVLAAQSPLITKDGTTTFFSHSPIEDIEAVNEKTTAAINFTKGDVVVKMLIKHFTFENALMQEHFNENYMESEKFPAAIFKGKLVNNETIDVSQDGTYEVTLKGQLTIRGISTPLETPATITIAGDQVSAVTKFVARPVEYGIKIPAVVIKNIAEEIQVSTSLIFSIAKK
jgi:polyisoprenoid-binding protein YceI